MKLANPFTDASIYLMSCLVFFLTRSLEERIQADSKDILLKPQCSVLPQVDVKKKRRKRGKKAGEASKNQVSDRILKPSFLNLTLRDI